MSDSHVFRHQASADWVKDVIEDELIGDVIPQSVHALHLVDNNLVVSELIKVY